MDTGSHLNKELSSWEGFVDDVDVLCGKIEAEMDKGRKFDGVFGVPRGGLILGVLISHRLGLPMLMAPTPNSLVVDDIADTGHSLKHMRDIGAFIATVYFHKQSVVIPDIWLREKGDKWVVFPWEIE